MQPRFASDKIREDKAKGLLELERHKCLAMRTFLNLFY